MSTLKIHTFVFSPFSENTYLVWDEESLQTWIIDPGAYNQHEKEELADFIEDNGLKPKKILLTHAHLDHVFGLAFVKRKYNIKAYLHADDMPIYDDVESRCKMWNIKGYEPSSIDGHLTEGDILTLGSQTFNVIHVPGHAPGHVAFINDAQKLIFGGDVLFRGSIGRTDLPLGNHAQLLKSIQEKLLTLPDDYVVCSGHGSSTRIGIERQTNPFLR